MTHWLIDSNVGFFMGGEMCRNCSEEMQGTVKRVHFLHHVFMPLRCTCSEGAALCPH